MSASLLSVFNWEKRFVEQCRPTLTLYCTYGATRLVKGQLQEKHLVQNLLLALQNYVYLFNQSN